MENSALVRFVNLRGKTSIVEFNFFKVVGKKSGNFVTFSRQEFSLVNFFPGENFVC